MLNPQYQSCIQACSSCALTCETCAASCLHEDDVKMMARCIQLDRDCADLCAVAALLMTRDSPYAQLACRLCAQACRDCAEECAKHAHAHCQDCAQACRRCAEECERMAA